jgi:hypothetical protein
VDKLAVSPLMQGLKLATVKVENATAALAVQSAIAAVQQSPSASAPVAPPRATWSFNLVSVEPPPPEVTSAAALPGSKP